MRILLLICVVITISGCYDIAYSDMGEMDAVRAIIGEAEAEGYEGMYAVAHALKNRNTLRGVYGHKAVNEEFKRGDRVISGKIIQKAMKAWYDAKNGHDVTNGANHWHNVGREGETYWTRVYQKTATIGNHVFYKGNV